MTLITVPGAVDTCGDSKIEEEGHHVPWNSALPDLRVLALSCGNDPHSGHGQEIEVPALDYVQFCLFSLSFC